MAPEKEGISMVRQIFVGTVSFAMTAILIVGSGAQGSGFLA